MRSPVITSELVAWVIIVTLTIIIIGEMPSYVFKALHTPKFYIGDFGVDWWHLSHFWFYMVIGAVCPGNYWFYTVIGSLFEVGESAMGAAGLKPNEVKNDHYWFGRWEDVVVNSLGYLIGEWSQTGSIDLTLP